MAYAETEFFGFRSLAFVDYLQTASVEMRLAVSVRPPKFRVVHDHLGKVALVEFDGFGLSGLQIYFLTESNVTRSDGTFYHSFALGVAIIGDFGLKGKFCERTGDEFRPHPRVGNRAFSRIFQPNLVGDAGIKSRNVGHPVPSAAGKVIGASLIGQRSAGNIDQYGQCVGTVAVY